MDELPGTPRAAVALISELRPLGKRIAKLETQVAELQAVVDSQSRQLGVAFYALNLTMASAGCPDGLRRDIAERLEVIHESLVKSSG